MPTPATQAALNTPEEGGQTTGLKKRLETDSHPIPLLAQRMGVAPSRNPSRKRTLFTRPRPRLPGVLQSCASQSAQHSLREPVIGDNKRLKRTRHSSAFIRGKQRKRSTRISEHCLPSSQALLLKNDLPQKLNLFPLLIEFGHEVALLHPYRNTFLGNLKISTGRPPDVPRYRIRTLPRDCFWQSVSLGLFRESRSPRCPNSRSRFPGALRRRPTA